MAAGTASKLAEAYVRIRADSTGLKKDLETIKRGLLGSVRLMSRAVAAAFRPVRAIMKTLIGGPLGAAGALLRSPLALLTGGVGVAMIGREAAMFEDAMAKSTAILKGANELMDELRVTARRTAVELGVSHEEIARSYFFLASAGLDAQQSLAAMPIVARFAKAGTFDMALATDLLTDALSALGLNSKDAQENLQNMTMLADTLVGANMLANASVQQFADALKFRGAATMRSYNIALEEGVALLAALADQGTKGQRAGQSLQILMTQLTVASLRNVDAFKKYSIEVFDNNQKLRNLADIVQSFEKNLGNLSAEARTAAFSQLGLTRQSLAVMLQLMGTSDAMRRYEKDLLGMAGSTERIAQRNMQSFAEVLKRLKATIIDFAITAFTPLFRLLEKGIKPLQAWIKRMSRELAEFLQRWGPTFTRWAALTVEIVENLWRAIAKVSEGVSGFAASIRSFIGAGAGAFGGFLDKVSLLTTNLPKAMQWIDALFLEVRGKAILFLREIEARIMAFFIKISTAASQLAIQWDREMGKLTVIESFTPSKVREVWMRVLTGENQAGAFRIGQMAADAYLKGARKQIEMSRGVLEGVFGGRRTKVLEELTVERGIKRAGLKMGELFGRALQRPTQLMMDMRQQALDLLAGKVPKIGGAAMPGMAAPAATAATGRGGFVGLAELSRSIQTAILGGAAEQRAQKQAADIAEIADNTRQTVEGLAAADTGVFAEGFA